MKQQQTKCPENRHRINKVKVRGSATLGLIHSCTYNNLYAYYFHETASLCAPRAGLKIVAIPPLCGWSLKCRRILIRSWREACTTLSAQHFKDMKNGPSSHAHGCSNSIFGEAQDGASAFRMSEACCSGRWEQSFSFLPPLSRSLLLQRRTLYPLLVIITISHRYNHRFTASKKPI